MFRSQTKKTWGQCRCAVNDLREKKKEDFQSQRIRPGEQCSTHEELYEKLPPALQCEKEKINRRGSGNPNTKNNSKHIKEIHYSLSIDTFRGAMSSNFCSEAVLEKVLVCRFTVLCVFAYYLVAGEHTHTCSRLQVGLWGQTLCQFCQHEEETEQRFPGSWVVYQNPNTLRPKQNSIFSRGKAEAVIYSMSQCVKV